MPQPNLSQGRRWSGEAALGLGLFYMMCALLHCVHKAKARAAFIDLWGGSYLLLNIIRFFFMQGLSRPSEVLFLEDISIFLACTYFMKVVRIFFSGEQNMSMTNFFRTMNGKCLTAFQE